MRQWTVRRQAITWTNDGVSIQIKFESEFYHFHQENAFVICQIGGYFVQGRWVNNNRYACFVMLYSSIR